MKILPLTVLFHEGPIARAYLANLRQSGFRVAKVIQLVYEKHPATGKVMGRGIPFRRWREAYAKWALDTSFNFWPRTIARQHPSFYAELKEETARVFGTSLNLLDEMLGKWDWSCYTDEVETLPVTGFRDPALAEAIRNTQTDQVLFTGGGLVPAELLSAANREFVHVHPGYLPDVRGADGLLWSVLTRGRAAASCFFLDSGLDTGDLVIAEEFDLPRLQSEWREKLDRKTLYRSVYSFIDPVLRAAVLTHSYEQSGARELEAKPQDREAGYVYHFMHPRLQERAFEDLWSRN